MVQSPELIYLCDQAGFLDHPGWPTRTQHRLSQSADETPTPCIGWMTTGRRTAVHSHQYKTTRAMIITSYNIYEACIDCCIYLAIVMSEIFCNPQADSLPKATGSISTHSSCVPGGACSSTSYNRIALRITMSTLLRCILCRLPWLVTTAVGGSRQGGGWWKSNGTVLSC